MIHTECYVAKLELFQKTLPTAYFEVITRKQYVPETPKQGHILSPSWKLLMTAKREKWSYEQYAIALLHEWGLEFSYGFMDTRQPKNTVIDKLHELYWISQTQNLYLICTESASYKCHREIVKALLLGWSPSRIIDYIHTHFDTLRAYPLPTEEGLLKARSVIV